jgi:hypothetical protein
VKQSTFQIGIKMKSTNAIRESKTILLETEETKLTDKRTNGKDGKTFIFKSYR